MKDDPSPLGLKPCCILCNSMSLYGGRWYSAFALLSAWLITMYRLCLACPMRASSTPRSAQPLTIHLRDEFRGCHCPCAAGLSIDNLEAPIMALPIYTMAYKDTTWKKCTVFIYPLGHNSYCARSFQTLPFLKG